MDDIEKQYDTIADEIQAKIQEAADALKQANEIAVKHGLKTLHVHHAIGLSDYGVDPSEESRTLHEEVIERLTFRPLLNEMDSAGWCSSGFEC